MTTQSYYKDRLGFDPREALYENSTSTATSSRLHQYHHQQQYSVSQRMSISPSGGGGVGIDHQYSVVDSSPAAKKARQSTSSLHPQGGYEDALTQFKGTMSIWEYFIENWDIVCKSKISKQNRSN